MKKTLKGVTNYCGKPARITCKITDERGYISITGELTPYRCRTPYVCGCMHNEIVKVFPELRPFIWLHLVNISDGSVSREIASSLFMLANDDEKAAQNMLHCTDNELRELSALVHYGLHRSHAWYRYDNDKKAYEVNGADSVRIYTARLESFGLRARRLQAIKEFYKVLA